MDKIEKAIIKRLLDAPTPLDYPHFADIAPDRDGFLLLTYMEKLQDAGFVKFIAGNDFHGRHIVTDVRLNRANYSAHLSHKKEQRKERLKSAIWWSISVAVATSISVVISKLWDKLFQ